MFEIFVSIKLPLFSWGMRQFQFSSRHAHVQIIVTVQAFFSASDLLLHLSSRNCVLVLHGSMNGNEKKQIEILLCELCEESIAVAATYNLSREWLKNDIYLIKNVVRLDSSIRLNL